LHISLMPFYVREKHLNYIMSLRTHLGSSEITMPLKHHNSLVITAYLASLLW
jgi:hypothetical protein